mgnify:CR=1 FL=1
MTRASILLRRFVALIVPAIVATVPNPAMACQGPYDATTFLLSALPPLQEGEIALEIEILRRLR